MSSRDSHTKLAGHTLMLETPRLLLAALLPGDQAQVYGLYAAPQVARELARLPRPWTMAAAGELIRSAQVALAQRRGFTLGVFLRDTGAFVGVVALRIPARDPGLDDGERAEAGGLGILGYSVQPESWGQGYAGEGAARLVRYAFEDLGLSALQASARSGNMASVHVLRRLGFTLVAAGLEEEPLAGGPPHLVDRYQLHREEVS